MKLNVVLSAVFVLLESSKFWGEVWHVYQNCTSGCRNVLQETINVKTCIQRRHNKQNLDFDQFLRSKFELYQLRLLSMQFICL